MNDFVVAPPYQPRWVKAADTSELIALYHLARTALAGSKPSRCDRMNWAAKEFANTHGYVSACGAYKDLDGLLA